MALRTETLHSMGKDSEADEKPRIRGKGNGVTGRKRQHGVRGKKRNQRRTCAWCRGRRRVKCREGRGDVDTVFCLFPLCRNKVLCSKKEGEKTGEARGVPRAATALMPGKAKLLFSDEQSRFNMSLEPTTLQAAWPRSAALDAPLPKVRMNVTRFGNVNR